jgi:hypothetical protein
VYVWLPNAKEPPPGVLRLKGRVEDLGLPEGCDAGFLIGGEAGGRHLGWNLKAKQVHKASPPPHHGSKNAVPPPIRKYVEK